MKKPVVVYVHGFMSGADSSKWQYLISQRDRWDSHLFEVDYCKEPPTMVMQRLVEFVDTLNDPIVIGHSLGAFFVRQLQELRPLRTILVNPSLRPSQTLFSDPARSLPREFLAYYQALKDILWDEYVLKSRAEQTLPAQIVLVEHGDEVINHEEQRHMHTNAEVYESLGGNHGYSQLNTIEQSIDKLENRPWQ